MAISAKRFDNQSKQTNIAVIDFIDSKSSQILNKAQSGTKKASDALGALAKGEGLDKIKSALEKVDKSGIFGDTRLATDGLSSVMTLANDAKQTLDKVTESVMPVIDNVNNAYKSISTEVKEAISIGMAIKSEVESKVTMGKQILDVAKSGDIKNVKDLKNLSEKIKSSGMLDQIKDTSRLQSLVSAASQKAHDYNMPGYFKDVSSVFDNPLDVAKPASDTIQYGCSRSDMNAVMDVADSKGSSFISVFNPSVTNDILGSFKTPPEINGSSSGSFFDMFDSTLTKVNDTWNKVNDLKSSIGSTINKSGEWTDVLESKTNSQPVFVTEDDVVTKVEEQDYLAGQYSLANNVTANSLPSIGTLDSKSKVQSLSVSNRPTLFSAEIAKISKEWGMVFDEKSVGSNRIKL